MDKSQIAKAFGKKAVDYDTHARVQKYVGHQLLSCLSQAVEGLEDDASAALRDGPLLDLGTGSGFFLPSLRHFWGNAPLLAADLSEGMIEHVSEHYSSLVDHCLVADAEALPIKSDSLSVIFSSMAIQWCEDLTQLFSELSRVAQPGGYLAFSTLMPNTLLELKDAWYQVDQRAHVNRFRTAEEMRSVMAQFGAVEVAHTERVVASYPSLKSLLHSIKGIGANTVLEGSRPMTKGQFKALSNAYESFRDSSGQLPASYDVFYGVLRIPASL